MDYIWVINPLGSDVSMGYVTGSRRRVLRYLRRKRKHDHLTYRPLTSYGSSDIRFSGWRSIIDESTSRKKADA
jgi:hypothetical protein